jgi:Tfp pilus assembly protein PilO
METLKQYRTPLLLGVGAVVAALVILAAWIMPQGHKLSTLDGQKQLLGTQEQALQTEIVTLQHDENQKVTNCKTLTNLLQEIPSSLDEGQFVLAVGALAQASGAPSIPSLAWGASTTGSGVNAVGVTLTLDGTFGQVMNFVKGIDGSTFPRLFTVSTFSVSPAGSSTSGGGGASSSGPPVIVGQSLQNGGTPGYQVSLQGSIYYAPSQTNACAAVAPTGA